MRAFPVYRTLTILLRALCIVMILGLVACGGSSSSSSDGGDDGGDSGTSLTDPYSALRAQVPTNGVVCDQDTCCWDDCQYDQVVCGQQNGLFAAVGSTLDGHDLDAAPDWWRSSLFYLASDHEMNVVSGRTESARSNYYYVAKYCESGEFHTAYTFALVYDAPTDFTGALALGETNFDYDCTSALNFCDGFCTPSCGTKECGNDGCGGSCGTCPSGEYCSALGNCLIDLTDNGDSSNTCDTCTSACSGLPGCCTGCGCICESACGMCF